MKLQELLDPTKPSHRALEVVVLALLAILSIAALVWVSTCLGLLVKALLVVAGLVLFAWFWELRRPDRGSWIERDRQGPPE